MKPLLILILLIAPAVFARADSLTDKFGLRFPDKPHLTAQQLYEMGNPDKVKEKTVGQLVLLDGVAMSSSPSPNIEILMPRELAGGTKEFGVWTAYLIGAVQGTSAWVTGKRYCIEGIIADEISGRYTIHILNARRGFEARDVGKQIPEFRIAVPEDIAKVKRFTVTGTLKQYGGYFGTYIHPDFGNVCEIDLANPPKGMIQFRDPKMVPTDPHPGYIPFRHILLVDKVSWDDPLTKSGRVTINLTDIEGSEKFLIQIQADRLEKGSKARILIRESDHDGIGGLIEAEGALK